MDDHRSSRLMVVTDWVELFSIRDTHNLCFARLTTSSDGVDKKERERVTTMRGEYHQSPYHLVI